MRRVIELVWHKWLKRPYRLAVHEQGQGEPVVLLHGIAATGAVWKPLLKKLPPEHYRVVVPDLLGFGDSPKPQLVGYDVRDHAKAVLATLRRCNVKLRFTIVAHSMGCLVAIHIAATHPELVKRLILYEPPLFADVPDHPKHSRRASQYLAFFGFLADHPELAATESHVLWRVAKKLTGFTLSEERWTAFERSLRNTIMEQTALDELRALQTPTDIIYGRLDVVVIRTEVKRILRANKNLKFHLVTQTHRVSGAVAHFIARLLDGRMP